uniref:Uncharacterized protein n=1 Tax=Macrostomum lignano TaxID=282301 RepID=A0A1I8FC85_9PLAT
MCGALASCKENRCLLGVGMVGEQFQDRLKRQVLRLGRPWTSSRTFSSATRGISSRASNPAQFPDSCCGSGVLDSPATKERKMRARPKKRARRRREGGFIHEHDCLDNLVAMNGVYMRAALITNSVHHLLRDNLPPDRLWKRAVLCRNSRPEAAVSR